MNSKNIRRYNYKYLDYVIPQLLFTFFTKITLADFIELLGKKGKMLLWIFVLF